MNVGIIIYSKTGNTLSVAEKLQEAIRSAGHTVNIERIETERDDPNSPLKKAPDTEPYEVLIFASPVHAFSLAKPMDAYLSQITDIKNKKVYCFITQQLKKSWMGGDRAVKQIISKCKKKGADVILSGGVNWSSAKRETQIEDIVTKMSSL